MKKRLLGLMLSVVTAIACLVGCSGSEGKVDGSNGGKELTELTFWHSMGGKGGEAINSLVEEFNSSQDEIKVVAEYQGAYDDAINKLKSSALGNSGPDIMQLYEIGTKWMIDSGYAIPMQDLIDEYEFDISSLEENIADYYTIDGKMYSMPFNTSTPLLYYNKDVFNEVGLDENVAPKNFEEIIEYSNKLLFKDDDKVERYGYAMQIYGWFFEQFLIKQELEYANKGNGREGNATEVVFDSNDGAANIINGWKELIESGVVANFGRDSDATTDAFASGKIAMTVASTASLADIKDKVNGKFEVGTAYFPAVSADDEGGVSIGGASLWIMDKDDENKAKAAFKFIKFMVSAESQAKWARATGYFSVTKDAYELSEMVEHLNNNPEFQTAIDQLREENNSSGAILGVFPEARATIEENIEKVLNNELETEEAVNNIADTVNNALEKYNKSNN